MCVYRLCEILQVDDVDKAIGIKSLLSVSSIADQLLPFCLDSKHTERKSVVWIMIICRLIWRQLGNVTLNIQTVGDFTFWLKDFLTAKVRT